jgi:hypothetical protein
MVTFIMTPTKSSGHAETRIYADFLAKSNLG